jgi:hypothetical protein
MVHYCENPVLNLRDLGLMARVLHLTGPLGGTAYLTVKDLAGQGPDGAITIASAAQHLERHGYLTRTRERVDGHLAPGGLWTVHLNNGQ